MGRLRRVFSVARLVAYVFAVSVADTVVGRHKICRKIAVVAFVVDDKTVVSFVRKTETAATCKKRAHGKTTASIGFLVGKFTKTAI